MASYEHIYKDLSHKQIRYLSMELQTLKKTLFYCKPQALLMLHNHSLTVISSSPMRMIPLGGGVSGVR
jgi:hypothetical protein